MLIIDQCVEVDAAIHCALILHGDCRLAGGKKFCNACAHFHDFLVNTVFPITDSVKGSALVVKTTSTGDSFATIWVLYVHHA
ncbi:hypothetical protein BDR04DRAFT_1092672, partial [Suillus decipiens]